MQVELAEHDDSRLPQQLDGAGVLGRYVVLGNAGAVGRAYARRVVEVFDRERDAVQRPAVFARRDLVARRLCFLTSCVEGRRQIGVQPIVERLGSCDAGVSELQRRDLPPLDELGGLGQRQVDQVRIDHGGTSSAWADSTPQQRGADGRLAAKR